MKKTGNIGTAGRKTNKLFAILAMCLTAVMFVSCGKPSVVAQAKTGPMLSPSDRGKAVFSGDNGQTYEVVSEFYGLRSPAPTKGDIINLSSQLCPYPFYLTEEKEDKVETIGSVGGYLFNTKLDSLKTSSMFYEAEDLFMTANHETSEVVCYKDYKGENSNVILIYSFSILSGSHWEKYKSGVTGAIIPEIIGAIDSISVTETNKEDVWEDRQET